MPSKRFLAPALSEVEGSLGMTCQTFTLNLVEPYLFTVKDHLHPGSKFVFDKKNVYILQSPSAGGR